MFVVSRKLFCSPYYYYRYGFNIHEITPQLGQPAASRLVRRGHCGVTREAAVPSNGRREGRRPLLERGQLVAAVLPAKKAYHCLGLYPDNGIGSGMGTE